MTEPTDAERAEFEAWAISEYISVNRSLDGTDGYFEGDSQIAWAAWQAARRTPTPQPTQAQAGAVPMYRLLQSGVDRIEAADEFLSDDTTTWAIDPNGIFSGNIYGGHVLRPARRRIKGGQHGADN